MTIIEFLNKAVSCFDDSNFDNLRLEIEIIMSHILGFNRVELYLNRNRLVSASELCELVRLLGRRFNREPVSYIVGRKEFWSLDFRVNKYVLIPRPETECLVRSLIPFFSAHSGSSMRVLDVGTGCGAVIIALASEFPLHEFYAIDLSFEAVFLAKENADRNNLNKSISFLLGHWMDALKPNKLFFDLIISNPPYIKSSDLNQLQPEVVLYEPSIALDGGQDGLVCLKRILKDSWRYLSVGGLLALEMGYDQRKDIVEIANSCGRYSSIKIFRDYDGLDRVIHMRKM